jgi:glycine/D-amino acid oxidase-like deaminating enzyme
MSEATSSTYDFAVIGGGIAGLAIAELLQRSGASVVLVERNETLCGGASSEQQGWFHTGALYSALPDQFFCRTLAGNLDDLVDYYSEFPNMNLHIGTHISTKGIRGWFSNHTLFYAYAGLRRVGWKWKAPWALALSRARRRISWYESLDSSRSLSQQIGTRMQPLQSIVHRSPLPIQQDDISFVLKSRDRPMDARLIGEDLLRSFLGSGGRLALGMHVETIAAGTVRGIRCSTGESVQFHVGHTVVATGKDSAAFEPHVRVYVSPLLVAVPAVAEVNFVRMSPDVTDTINHLHHDSGSLRYSVIGNAMSYAAGDWNDQRREEASQCLIERVRKIWHHIDLHRTKIYFGSKTEMEGARVPRNYLYRILDQDAYTVALPGKFSLCFSLAVNVCRHFGVEPARQIRMASGEMDSLVAVPQHLQFARQLSGLPPMGGSPVLPHSRLLSRS